MAGVASKPLFVGTMVVGALAALVTYVVALGAIREIRHFALLEPRGDPPAERLIAAGDVIEIGNTVGTVEAIGLRVTQLRTLKGAVRVVPNGELTQFANYSRGWGRAVVDVGVAWEEDIRRALGTLEAVGRGWAQETGLALEPPEVQGIVRFGDAEIGLRLQVKVPPARREEIENDLRRRIVEAFRAAGIREPKKVFYVVEHPGGNLEGG